LHYDIRDQYQPGSSLIHRLDPRVKVMLAFGVILAISLMAEGAWVAFGFVFLLLLLCSAQSELGPTFAVRRSYVAIPFMLAALAVPFTVSGPLLMELPLLGWRISEPGAVRFLSILARSWLAVQTAVLLTATTRFPDLMWALGALRLPRTLVSTITFMYRYLFVLADEANRMLRARAARSVSSFQGRRPSVAWQGRVAGSMVGSFFLRAMERSERIYAAMLARGYDGHMRSVGEFNMRSQDWWMLTLPLIVLILVLAASHMI
jgi:cobalt/nickel transport system permease protein